METIFETEEALVAKLQCGECDRLYYVTHRDKETKDDYIAYCQLNGLSLDDRSASMYLSSIDREISESHAI